MSADPRVATVGGWGSGSPWRRAWWVAIPALSTLAVLGMAMIGPLALVPIVGAAFLLWSIQDVRVAYLIAVLLASFVNTSGGHLIVQLAMVYLWLAWSALLTFWRSAWRPWTPSPAPVGIAILIWFGVCLLGAVVGAFGRNEPRIILLEWSGSAWPALALLVCQLQSRRTLVHASIGLTLIALAHTVFGLAWLKIAHERLGGVYFTTVPGFVAVGVWAVILLAPSSSVRRWSFVLLVPLLMHQFYSFTRGYWLGVLVGIAVATVLAHRGWRPARRPMSSLGLAVGAAAVLVGTLALSVFYFGRDDVLQSAGKRFQSSFSLEASGETGSNIMRLAEYSLALEGIRESPVIGKGWGYTITDRDPFTGDRFRQGVIHNYYLFLWLKIGLIGLAVFAYYVFRFLKSSIRAAKEEQDWLARAWIVSAVAMTVQALAICLTNYSLSDFCTGIFLAYVWGTALALQSRGLSSRRTRSTAAATG